MDLQSHLHFFGNILLRLFFQSEVIYENMLTDNHEIYNAITGGVLLLKNLPHMLWFIPHALSCHIMKQFPAISSKTLTLLRSSL